MNTIQLSQIRLDGGTQCRASLDQEHISTLAEAWAGGAKIPAVVVFYDGSNYWLADGFHRYHAAQENEFNDILADVRSGTRLDAVKFALGANAAHGLRRTNADKRRAVEIALENFPKLSDRQIAEVCAVGHPMVGRIREEQLEQCSSSPRLGADGKTRKLPARKSDSVSNLEPSPSKGSVADLTEPACPVAPIIHLEPKPSRKAEADTTYIPANGIMYARIAIAQLEKIDPSDKERAAAFELVRNYLNERAAE